MDFNYYNNFLSFFADKSIKKTLRGKKREGIIVSINLKYIGGFPDVSWRKEGTY